jgi:hypothetical protein
MQSLRLNNTPYRDHGIEVMYRFAKFDPFERSRYFGCAILASVPQDDLHYEIVHQQTLSRT